MKQNNSVLLSVMVANVCAVSLAVAENSDSDGDRFQLGEVVVTARARDNSMIGGAEIQQEELRKFGKTTVDSALDLISGASAGSTGGSRNERLVFVRGFDRFQTTLSIDGVRVFLPADNRIDFARFLTADLSTIQISKGYVSVLDGPGGLGGAINLVTRKPSEAVEAEAVINGSFDNDLAYSGYTVSSRIGAKQEKFYVQISGTKADTDHWSLSDDFTPTALEDGGERNHSDSNDYRINLKAGYTPNATDEYALNFTKQAGEKNAPYHVTDTASTRFWAWPYWDIDSIYFLSNTQLTPNSYLRTRVYVNSFDNALFSYDDAAQSIQSLPRAFRSYYEDKAYGARVEYGVTLSDVNTLRSSLHYRSDKHGEWQDGFVRVPATGTPFTNVAYTEPKQTTKEDTYSIALEDTQQFGANLDLVVGASYDWTKLKQAEDFSIFVTGSTINRLPVSYPLKNAHAANGQAALSYRWSDEVKTHISVSSRVRFPTLFERFSSRFGTAVPNPDIKQERATNVEIGSDVKLTQNLQIDGAIFYSDVSDALISVPVVFGAPISATLNQTRNVGDGKYFGVELSATGKISDALQFLDEIGDMSLKTQAKVLRVLQEQELERLGSNRIIKVDVRVIAATNKNLEEEINRNTFREDLFYRLNVVPIHVPALRERRDDIPALVRHFADLFARDNNFHRKTFTAAAMDRLKQQHWRGNIRELRNFVERLMIMSGSDAIDVRDIPEGSAMRGETAAALSAAAGGASAAPTEAGWMQAPTLQEFKSNSERAYLVSKLRENAWNISKTAEVIDTPRSNLYKKLEQYAISQETDG